MIFSTAGVSGSHHPLLMIFPAFLSAYFARRTPDKYDVALLPRENDELIEIERAARAELADFPEARTEQLLRGDDAALDKANRRIG